MKTNVLRIFITFTLLFILAGCSSNEEPSMTNDQQQQDEQQQDQNDEEPEEESFEEKLQKIINSKVYNGGLVGVSVSIRVNGEERWSLTGGVQTKPN